MKKILILFTFFLLVSFVSSIEFDVASEFQKNSMFSSKVSGVFTESLTKDKINFYRGHTRIAMDHYLLKMNDEYYIYASLEGKEPNNYTIKLEDVSYKKGVETIEGDLEQDFIITNESADFLIDKGAVISNDTFSINVVNFLDKKLEVNIFFEKVVLDNGVETEEMGFFELLFSSNEVVLENLTEPEGYSFELKSGESEDIKFEVYGIREEKMKVISFVSENTVYEIPVLLLENEKSIKRDKNETEENDNETEVEEINETEENNKTETELKANMISCEEQNGTLCLENEQCSTKDFFTAKDGACCRGECVEVEKSNTGKVIGWLLILGVLFFIYWFFNTQYRKTKNKLNFQKVLEKKSFKAK